MTKYVLNYFPLIGRAEPARLLFRLAGKEFTDNMVQFADWPVSKKDAEKFPLGQMPTLQVDGVTICQSAAVFSYLANEFGYYGGSNMEKATIDQLRECMVEIFEGTAKIKYDATLEEKEKAKKMIENFESVRNKILFGFLAKHATGKFFLGDKLSVADVIYFVYHEYFAAFYPDFGTAYPALTTLHDSIGSVEAIKARVESRELGY